MEMIRMRCGSFGLHHHPRSLQSHAPRNAASLRLVQQPLSKVIRDEDPLNPRVTIPEQGFDERPVARIVETGSGQGRSTPCSVEFHESVVVQRLSSGVDHVETEVDIATALMRLVLPNRSASATREVSYAQLDGSVSFVDLASGSSYQPDELR